MARIGRARERAVEGARDRGLRLDLGGLGSEREELVANEDLVEERGDGSASAVAAEGGALEVRHLRRGDPRGRRRRSCESSVRRATTATAFARRSASAARRAPRPASSASVSPWTRRSPAARLAAAREPAPHHVPVALRRETRRGRLGRAQDAGRAEHLVVDAHESIALGTEPVRLVQAAHDLDHRLRRHHRGCPPSRPSPLCGWSAAARRARAARARGRSTSSGLSSRAPRTLPCSSSRRSRCRRFSVRPSCLCAPTPRPPRMSLKRRATRRFSIASGLPRRF